MIVDDGIVISMGCTVTLECANNNFELVSFSTKTKLFSSSEAGCLCFAWRLEVDSSCCCDRDRELVSYLGIVSGPPWVMRRKECAGDKQIFGGMALSPLFH